MKKISFLFIILFITILSFIFTGCTMKYRVFFNEYDGTINYQDVKEGECAIEYSPLMEGFDFLGWYTEDDELYDFSTPVTKNINLYAYYGLKEWDVLFVVDNNEESKNFSVKVTNNRLVSKPVDPVRDGYIFLGWVQDDHEFLFDKTTITSNTTIYANFVKDDAYKPYLIVTLNANNNTEVMTIGVDRLSKISSLPIPTKDGFRFVGWFLGNEQITTDTIIKEISDFTLYAHYEKIE